jgi:fructose-specific component phosphotransferase system IIB-like protein
VIGINVKAVVYKYQ